MEGRLATSPRTSFGPVVGDECLVVFGCSSGTAETDHWEHDFQAALDENYPQLFAFELSVITRFCPCQAAALKSFFHVPRVLRRGEVLALPQRGLSEELRAVEVPQNPAESRVLPEDIEEEAEVYETAPHLGLEVSADALHGFAFYHFFSFKVEVIEGPGESQSFQIDRAAEILLKGSSHARGIPYISSHHFCEAPPAILPSLRPAMERLLGMLAPAVRAWELRTVPDLPSVLTIGPRGCGKRILWRSVCERLGLHLLEVNSSQLADGGTEARRL